MTPILQQFLSESRDFLQAIGEKLLKLEKSPGDADLMTDLFRSVHTLKGNSGLFDFPEMTRVLHAAEDLMSSVREGQTGFDRGVADRLLDAMDLVSLLLDEIGGGAESCAAHASASAHLADALRRLIMSGASGAAAGADAAGGTASVAGAADVAAADAGAADAVATADFLGGLPEALRTEWAAAAAAGEVLHWLRYEPETDCFFKGEDPFFQARQTPGLIWHTVGAREAWPPLADLDPYRCVLRFDLVSRAPRQALDEHFRYVPEQLRVVALGAAAFAAKAGAGTPTGLPRAATAGITTNHAAVVESVLAAQAGALALTHAPATLPGTLKAIAATLAACYSSLGRVDLRPKLDAALAAALAAGSGAPLLGWLDAQRAAAKATAPAPAPATPPAQGPEPGPAAPVSGAPGSAAVEATPTTLKVEQEKVDKLMSLIGEMVVAKNALPFLAGRAESVYGSRDLAREIKAQYAVINRIAEEMQDAIMQVRMMPVSTVFQRFPRLVRDLSRKLGKQVSLTLEGEATEADKNIIEALADPLIHIVRNSLDHGLETPEARRAAGKPPDGRLVIRASQDSGRVNIDISDDGKGIDPAIIKRKAYEKGLIDEGTLERIGDQAAVNLVFAAGFSTAETVSDLSGRGVGMDVVRSAVERVGGTVTLESEVGQGTRIRLSLPLSMAVTHVMVIESNQQIFGVPMDLVLETVRVPREDIREIKNRQTTVLRNRILPLRSLNEMLHAAAPQLSNDQDEMATLVVEIHGERLGIMVDAFREVADIILKPMAGILRAVPGYSGSALLGDGSVLMVLDPKELVTWH